MTSNSKFAREAIVLHKPTGAWGRITRIDSDGNCSFQTNPHRGAARQVKANVCDCVFVAYDWKQAWERLGAWGVCDPRTVRKVESEGVWG
jgi:hypothetical protein